MLKLYMELQDDSGSQPDEDQGEFSSLPAYHLLRGDCDAALQAAREWARHLPNPCICAPHIASWELIRAELSCGHWQAAKRLMGLKQSSEHHYLDGLFLARIELRAGHPEVAARHFANVLEAAGRHGAEKRIDFELRLARELAPGELLALTRDAMACDRRSLKSKSAVVRESSEYGGADRLTGGALEGVRAAIRRVANLDTTVLISGETGTGKDLVACAVHEESDRREETFLAVNCAAISENLIETELFGHVKGAFTGAHRAHRGIFEQVGAGTVFLDEIGDMPTRLQATLLRVLETGEFRPVGSASPRQFQGRIIAATHDDLETLVARGVFRSDLLYRLRRIQIAIPSLRQRREDIPALAEYFLNRDRESDHRASLSSDLVRMLVAYDWPGNVREFRNDIENMRLLNSEIDHYDVANLDQDVLARLRGEKTVGVVTSPAAAEAHSDTCTKRIIASGTSPFRRHERLRELFLEYVNLSRAEIIQILGTSPATATRDLKRLREEGIIEKICPSASPRSHYFTLKPGNRCHVLTRNTSGDGSTASQLERRSKRNEAS